MTLAKLTYKGITYNIASKEDLIKFNNIFIKDNPRKDIFKNPHYLLGSGISMQLHPMLDKYNLMDFLFT
jgi:hypothetical protein